MYLEKFLPDKKWQPWSKSAAPKQNMSPLADIKCNYKFYSCITKALHMSSQLTIELLKVI